MKGWISLHRDILDSQYGGNLELLGLFCALMLKANHKKGYANDGTPINEGQFLTSQKSLSDEFNVERNAMRRKLKKLENAHQIKQETCNKNTIITIVNWHKYQNSEQQNEHQLNSKRTSNEHQVNTNNNNNNNNNGINKKQTKKQTPSAGEFDFDFIYNLYPKKIGKASGLKKLRSKIKSQKKYDEVLQATKNYAEFVRLNKTDAQYIKHFTTFVNNYQDWIDLNVSEQKSQSGVRKDLILSILSRGFASLVDLKQNSDITLTFDEESLIRESGGLLQMSKMSQYDINRILSGNN